VEAYNTGETESRILQNTTAIPSQGNFSATSLYSPSTSASAGDGRFSHAPDGDLAYCNGEESIIWGGAEREIAGFINYDPDGTFAYDYTEEVRNTKTTTGNVAPLAARSSGLDSDTLLLLHFDNNDDDSSPTTPHTLTPVGTVLYTNSPPIFGTYKASLATDAYFTIPDNADFDLSGGTFTIDVRFKGTYVESTYIHPLWYQHTTDDDDSFMFYVDDDGSVKVRIKVGGAKQFSGATDFSTAAGVIVAGTTYHIELVESGNNWYIFVDGALKAYTSDAARAADYSEVAKIGSNGVNFMNGFLDEFRLSGIARHTSPFEVPSEAYSTATTEAIMYVASVRPLDGVKFYVSTVNASASTMTGFYWDGSAWVSVSSLVDGTSASSKSLAQTNSVTFTSTASTAKLKYFEGILAYWYKFRVSATSGSPAISHVTVSTPFQAIQDIWDGVPVLIDSFQKYGTYYKDGTMHVREEEYDNLNSGTFVSVEGQTSSQWFICGFSEKMSGVNIYMASGLENEAAGTTMGVDYWNGAAWTTVGTVDDGTLSGTISLGKNGTVTWNPPTTEHRQTINPASTLSSIQYLTTRARKKKDRIKYNNQFTQTVVLLQV
jgi:hypothetical protein